MNWLERTLWAEPLWATGLVYLVVLLLASWAGVVLGRRRQQPDLSTSPPATTVDAALLGLLALLLAFTYSEAARRFELRRSLLVEEANAIGTVWLRADFLPEPGRSQLREALRQYTSLRVVPEEAGTDLAAAERRVRASQALHARMWAAATNSIQRRDPLDAILISELNHLIDLHTSRMASYEYRVPAAVLLLLGLVSVLSVALMGFGFGQVGRSSPGLLLVLALVIAAVVLCILDLDQSHRGLTRIRQTSLQQLARAAAPIAPTSPSPPQSPG